MTTDNRAFRIITLSVAVIYIIMILLISILSSGAPVFKVSEASGNVLDCARILNVLSATYPQASVTARKSTGEEYTTSLYLYTGRKISPKSERGYAY